MNWSHNDTVAPGVNGFCEDILLIWKFYLYYLNFITKNFSPPPNPQAGGLPAVGCRRLLIQSVTRYPPYVEVAFSIRNMKTRQAVAITMGRYSPTLFKFVSVHI